MSITRRERATAITGLMIGCVIFGLGSLIVAFVPIGAYAIAFWRMLIGGVVFGALFMLRRDHLPKNRRAIVFAGLSGIFLAVDLSLWHESIYAVGPGISTLLNSLQIFFLAALGWILFQERLSLQQTFSLFLAIIGVGLIASPEFAHNSAATWGFISGGLSAAMLAASMTAIRLTHASEPTPLVPLMVVLNFSGAFAILPIALLSDAAFFPTNWHDIALVATYGLVMQSLAWTMIAWAIPRLSLALTGLILLSEPVAALIIDYLLLDKSINGLQWTGASLTLLAIYLGSVAKKKAA
ncbi:DMT family transporter [Suttonella sp. R2A3]|uniref:DMT family transporter n=1 Tax=Suttonella sp. R2A3 TaxID=2908648 RepID=UPI001F2724CC|nr:DMT family transporter [Suttonella sp. R2A3]UJF24934.1 DMT family transporter [Suttonella sp. R2A3]